jgi:hypothetical protein
LAHEPEVEIEEDMNKYLIILHGVNFTFWVGGWEARPWVAFCTQ